MKKQLTKAALALVCGLFAVACASDTPVEPVASDSEPVEILLNGGVSLAASPDAQVASTSADGGALPAARAVIDQSHGEVALAFARVDATTSGASPTYPAWSSTTAGEVKCLNATLAANTGETNPGTKAITFLTPQYYLANAYYTKLVGWAPSVASDSNSQPASGSGSGSGGGASGGSGGSGSGATTSTFSNGTITCPIDGKTDIMLSQELQGNKTLATQFSASSPFAFKHLLTQIKVSACAVDAAGKAQWGTITAIKVKDAANKECKIVLPSGTSGINDGTNGGDPTITYDLQTGQSAADLALIYKKADTDADINFPLTLYYDGESGAPSAGFKQECGYAMFAPVAATGASGSESATVTLLVSTSGSGDGKAVTDWPVNVTLSGAEGFKAGTVYGITLRFSAQTIGISGTVTEWTDHNWSGDFNGEITL